MERTGCTAKPPRPAPVLQGREHMSDTARKEQAGEDNPERKEVIGGKKTEGQRKLGKQ